MLLIDTHIHVGLNWYEPVEQAIHQMDDNGVSFAVLIQHYGSHDNAYHLECVRRYPGRLKSVVLIDPLDADKPKTLVELHKQGASAVRLMLKRDWRVDDPVWKLAGELGMVIDVIGESANFASAEFKKLLDRYPDTRFCLEHLCRGAMPNHDMPQPPYTTYKSALECARWPNTVTKVPGLGEILTRPDRLPVAFPFVDDTPFIEMAREAFGVQRMMWGSHYPTCSFMEGYRNALNGIRNHPAFRNGDDAEWVMGKSARKFWGFPSVP